MLFDISSKFIFVLVFGWCHVFAVSAPLPGHPTFPIPFYNDLNVGCCHQNAFLQCMLACPHFCSFLDRINSQKPKPELIAHLKRLRLNLQAFSCFCDETALLSFLSRPMSGLDDRELRNLIIGCSKEPCLGILEFMKTSCTKELKEMSLSKVNYIFVFEYLFLKKMFGVKSFYYLDELKSVFNLQKIKFSAEYKAFEYFYEKRSQSPLNWLRSHGFDFVYLDVPSLALFVVMRTCSLENLPKLTANVKNLNDIISSLESFFTTKIGRTCSLRAIHFTVNRTLNFGRRSDCPISLWDTMTRQGCLCVDGKLSSYVSFVEEVPSNFLVHCAAYVRHDRDWYFCDDFFRECLCRPLIRKIQGNVRNVLTDLLQKEQGGEEVLFFCADA